MNLKEIRDGGKLAGALLFMFIYLPHLICTFVSKTKKEYIFSDVRALKSQICLRLNDIFALLYLLHCSSYFRSLFYHRLGPLMSAAIGWYRPGNKYFTFSFHTKIGKGMRFFHPYATVINAQSIGDNFCCLQLTTLGSTATGTPTIGDNVALGANVTIIGGIKIGNNVTIGAGSVVVKDIPDNCMAAGNPAKVIKYVKD